MGQGKTGNIASVKKFNSLIRKRSGDLLVGSTVAEPTAVESATQNSAILREKLDSLLFNDIMFNRSFHGGDYEEWSLLGYYTVWLL
jgi:hypothetical protein